MEHKKRFYETTVIINPTLEEHQIEAIIKNVEELITKNGATHKITERWGRKRLSYPINKRNNGYYAYFEFEGGGGNIVDLERNLEYDENVMRYLTVRIDPKVQEAKEQQKLKPREPAENNEENEIEVISPDIDSDDNQPESKE